MLSSNANSETHNRYASDVVSGTDAHDSPETRAAQIALEAGVGIQADRDLDKLPAELVDLLNTGRFTEYHVEKAKMALANKDYKQAKYQVAASMCHGRTEAAIALKKQIYAEAQR